MEAEIIIKIANLLDVVADELIRLTKAIDSSNKQIFLLEKKIDILQEKLRRSKKK